MHLPRRNPGRRVVAAQAAARVASVLRPTAAPADARGWTPAALAVEGAPALPVRAPDRPADELLTGAQAALGTPAVENPALSRAALEPPAQSPTALEALGPAARRSWTYDPSVGGLPDRGPAVERDPSLVARLRSGRVDPGRRGVAALALVGVLAAALTAVVVVRGRPQAVEPSAVIAPGTPVPGASTAPAGAGGELVIAVAGAVRRPGVVRLPAGSRVDDAVRAAGGAVSADHLALVNLARKLTDGEQVLIGVEAPAGEPGAPAGPGDDGTVDLNTATLEQLDALPGIGPVLAQKILDYRTESSGFASVDQLREVAGIGEARFAELEAKVRV